MRRGFGNKVAGLGGKAEIVQPPCDRNTDRGILGGCGQEVEAGENGLGIGSRSRPPGIGRAEYGGLLLSLPPRRMYDVWRDPDYNYVARTKPERLLLAGIDVRVARAPKDAEAVVEAQVHAGGLDGEGVERLDAQPARRDELLDCAIAQHHTLLRV